MCVVRGESEGESECMMDESEWMRGEEGWE